SDLGSTFAQAGVIATRPALAPETLPMLLGRDARRRSIMIQVIMPAAGAARVLIQMRPPCSIVVAAPQLKPNQPNHSRAVPSTVIGMLCGLCGVEKRARRPMMTTSTSAEMPALM